MVQSGSGFSGLYGLLMGLGFLGLMAAMVLYTLAKISSMSVMSGDAGTAVNKTIDALATIPDWFEILVVLAIVGVLFYFLFRAFGSMGQGR